MTNLFFFLLFMQPEGEDGGGIMSFLPLILIVLVFYLFFIRPQMKKSKDQKKFRSSLQKGAKVVTIGGIHGKIVEIKDDAVILDVGKEVRMVFDKSAIALDSSTRLSETNK